MKYFVGMLAAVLLVAAVTVGAYKVWDDLGGSPRNDNGGVLNVEPATTIPPEQPAPAPGTVAVSGSVTGAHLVGAVLPPLATPITVTTPQRGGGAGATISGIQVGGKPSAIEWDAGTPLALSGDGGALMLAPVTVDIGADGPRVLLDTAKGQPHGFVPATYHVDAPVAVGTGSLAAPQDSATFVATADSRVEFRGTSTAPLPDGALTNVTGTGSLVLTGQFTIVHPDRTTSTATTITLDSGSYQLGLAPASTGGYSLLATIVGTIR